MKKVVSIFLAALLMTSLMLVPAYAELDVGLYNSDYFSSYGTVLSNVGNCIIKIVFAADGTEICDEIGVATFQVQRYDENGNWEDVTGMVVGETGENVVSYTFSKYFQGVLGERYRVQVTFVSYIDGSAEYKTYTSGVITAKQNRD